MARDFTSPSTPPFVRKFRAPFQIVRNTKFSKPPRFSNSLSCSQNPSLNSDSMAVPRNSGDNSPAAGESSMPAEESPISAAPSGERSNSPGVRALDSENYVYCHQCRQKTMNISAQCKQIRRGKPCPIKYCHKCLLNRYGENAQAVGLTENWICPKCRCVCNCSYCMKKKGQLPTGILIHTAKATGFSSVHELLDKQGSEMLNAANGLRILSSGSGTRRNGSVAPKTNHKKENYHDEPQNTKAFDGADDNKVESTVQREKKRLRKQKRESECGAETSTRSSRMETKSNSDESVPMNCTSSEHGSSQHMVVPAKESNANIDNSAKINGKTALPERLKKKVKAKHMQKELKPGTCTTNIDFQQDNFAPVIPQGTLLTAAGGVDWAAEDVGAALQFLEFCNAFSKVLDIKKGEPESVLRELARGSVGRRGVYSSIVKFHMKLLSFVQKDNGDRPVSISITNEDKWLESVVKYITNSEHAFKMPLEVLAKGSLGYDNWAPSYKLQLLNHICDMTLGTVELRSRIDEENKQHIDRKKEARETLIAAKKKGEDLKKQMKDDAAKSILSLGEEPLSVADHNDFILQIKSEQEKAHAEILDKMEQLPKNSNDIRQDALRTQPILIEGGHAYWKLGGSCNNSKIMHQDIGSWDSVILEDKWFTYNEGEEKLVEKIISLRKKKRRTRRNYLKQNSELINGDCSTGSSASERVKKQTLDF